MLPTYCIALVGDEGGRLGGASRADASAGGRRLLDHVAVGVCPFVSGRVAAVAPDPVDVPPEVLKTLEGLPVGGPFTGINTGLRALGASVAPARAAVPTRMATPADSPWGTPGSAALADGSVREPSAAAQDMVLVFVVDMPRTETLALELVAITCGRGDAVVVGGEPSFRQYSRAICRIKVSRAVVEKTGDPRNKGVCRTLAGLDLAGVPSSANECRGVDTPEDVSW